MSKPIAFGKPQSDERCRLAIAPAAMPDAARRTAKRSRELGCHHATAGMEQQHVATVSLLAEPVLQPVHVPGDERGENGVGDGRREALVLEDLGQHLGGRRDGHARKLLLEDLAHAALVRRVRVRVDEADGHRLDSAAPQNGSDLARHALVERGHHLAGVIDPLGHLEAVTAADVRRRDIGVGVPQVCLRAAADLDHVAKVLRRHHRRRREVARDQRVRGHGGPVREQHDVAQVDARVDDACNHGIDRVGSSTEPCRPRSRPHPRRGCRCR